MQLFKKRLKINSTLFFINETQKGINMKTRSLIILACLLTLSLSYGSTEKHSATPAKGFVPDKETAITIAIAVWTPIYGKKQIEKQKPYRAKLIDGVWFVQGTLNHSKKEIKVGGVAMAEISKTDGRIIRVSHGK